MVTQGFDLWKRVTSFDVLDVIAPLGSVHPCIHSTGLGRGGWINLAVAAKITFPSITITLFRPKQLQPQPDLE